MKGKKITITLIIMNILTIGVVYNFINKDYLNNKRTIVKAMTEGEYENKLTELNRSHEDYTLQVQENKKKIATAITNQKVTTSKDASIDEMVTNIGKILQIGTADATATAEDIASGKTAYINGELVKGTLNTSNSSVEVIAKQYSLGTVSTSNTSITKNVALDGYRMVGAGITCGNSPGTTSNNNWFWWQLTYDTTAQTVTVSRRDSSGTQSVNLSYSDSLTVFYIQN